jgi:hypothetical protein
MGTTMSRMTDASEDFENMDVMKIEGLYETTEGEYKALLEERKKLTKGKKGPDFGTKQ